MSNQSNISTDNLSTIVCTVLLGESEKEMPEKYVVLGASVTKEVNKIPSLKLIIRDGDPALQNFEISNTDDLIPGQLVTLKINYINEEKVDPVFKGVIVKHALKARRDKPSILTLDCKDSSVKMTVNRHNKYFKEGTTDSEAIEEILKTYKSDGLSKKVESTKYKHPELVQYYTTDWDFIVKRAEANGQLVFADDGVVTTKQPTLGEKADFTPEYGINLLEFEAEIDARNQYEKIEGSSWDYAKQKLATEEVSNVAGVTLDQGGDIDNKTLARVFNEEGKHCQHAGQLVNTDLKKWLEAEWVKSQLARIRGRAQFLGTPSVKPGMTLELKGTSNRFNGPAYITGVRQEYTPGRWTTDAQFGLKPDWFEAQESMEAPKAGGLIPAISGLHIGIVTAIHDDPNKEDRIKVRVPVLSDQEEGTWARISRLDAGMHRGTFFTPELNNEVIVGFLDADPRFPIILGMLNSSKYPAPVEALKKDNLKGIYSKIGSRLEFDDNKRTIKLQSLNGDEEKDLKKLRKKEPKEIDNNTILLDDDNQRIKIQDKNENCITLDENGITIFSKKDINIEGENVNITAKKGKVKSHGTDGAEYTSGQNTIVKGSKVLIN